MNIKFKYLLITVLLVLISTIIIALTFKYGAGNSNLKAIILLEIICFSIISGIVMFMLMKNLSKEIETITETIEEFSQGKIIKFEDKDKGVLSKLKLNFNRVSAAYENNIDKTKKILTGNFEDGGLTAETELAKNLNTIRDNYKRLYNNLKILNSKKFEIEDLTIKDNNSIDVLIKNTAENILVSCEDLKNIKFGKRLHQSENNTKLQSEIVRLSERIYNTDNILNKLNSDAFDEVIFKEDLKYICGNNIESLVKKIKILSEQVNSIMIENFDSQIFGESCFGSLGQKIVKLNKKQKKLTGNLNTILDSIGLISGAIKKVSDEMQNSSQEFVLKSGEQSDIIKNTIEKLSQFSTSVQQISSNCQESKKNSNNTLEESGKNLENINKVNLEMEKISDSIKMTSNKLQELHDSSKKISQIVDIITNISEKTALLALNAAIEAARAGESGRGFAVVADEVNDLAEKTNKSVKEISMLVETIKAQTEMSVESMNSGIELVGNGVTLIDKVTGSVKNMNKFIQDTNSSIIEIASAVNEQNRVVNSIITNTDNLKQIIENVSSQSNILQNNGKELATNTQQLEGLLTINKI